MKILDIKNLDNTALLQSAHKLRAEGKVIESHQGLTYLKIADEYIHDLYPHIQDEFVEKPDYFSDEGIGAHLSIIYPEERISLGTEDLGRAINFKITGLYSADLLEKKYFVLGVDAPAILALRQAYGLPTKLCLKNHWVDLHITIGVKELRVKC